MGTISVFDIFKIGIGPSSSHTGGPMLAAATFADKVAAANRPVDAIVVTLHGSLAYTGRGHGTDKAVQLGLAGFRPADVDPDAVPAFLSDIAEQKRLTVPGIGSVAFDPDVDIRYNYQDELPRHTNGMRFVAADANGDVLLDEIYYSLGGGFIACGDEPEASGKPTEPRYRFKRANELLAIAAAEGKTIAEIQYANECCWRSPDEVDAGIDEIWQAMSDCIARGLSTDGVLPGRMAVVRRAAKLARRLEGRSDVSPMNTMDWVDAFAIAVNEENAAGGKIVTSPTNGAAGIIPAVLMYYHRFVSDASREGIHAFLMTAGAIGALYKSNASISGAEMGCQGEVGVACSMAAGGLAAACGGDNDQVEEAAEIGMEHNLGLTCDPIGGLVQIPCIERNAMGAIKAINASRLATHGDGTHKVSLDQVIDTMRQTGLDMSAHYKETSKAGLAVNVPDC